MALHLLHATGDFPVPVVLNNLIAKEELPVMAAVFVDSREVSWYYTLRKGIGWFPLLSASDYNSPRAIEYEVLSAVYANFLVEEILPLIREHVRITNDPEGRDVAALAAVPIVPLRWLGSVQISYRSSRP
jgi:enterochelin esterase-like enzyme